MSTAVVLAPVLPLLLCVFLSLTAWSVTVSAVSAQVESLAESIAASVVRSEAEAGEHLIQSHRWLPASGAQSVNSYPIILIPGFTGWQRSELYGFKYFGGLYGDIQQILTNAGFTTYTVAGGPLSSTYDRACEDFAQIKGGVVDYGASHAHQFSHARFQRNYTGVYPQWGERNAQGYINKVHIIAHSEGGQDARILTSLLNAGSAAELAFSYPSSAPISPLFTGGHDWVASVVTLSTPHDGATLAAVLENFKSALMDTINGLTALAGAAEPEIKSVYDLKLDQWGLERANGEPFTSYINRVFASSIWNPASNKDTPFWNVDPDGASEVNTNYPPISQVYYLTYVTSATYRVPFVGTWLPDIDMFPVFIPIAILMGSYTRAASTGQIALDSSWWESDGLVNTRSQPGPTIGVPAQYGNVVVPYRGTLYGGKFNVMGKLEGWDHLAIVGIGDKPDVILFFEEIASFLATSIPVTDTPTASNSVTSTALPTATASAISIVPTIVVAVDAPRIPSNSSNWTIPDAASCGADQRITDELNYQQMCGANFGAQLVPGVSLTAQQCQTIYWNLQYCKSHAVLTQATSDAQSATSFLGRLETVLTTVVSTLLASLVMTDKGGFGQFVWDSS